MTDMHEKFIRHDYVKGNFITPDGFNIDDWRLVEKAWIARRDLQKSIDEWSIRDCCAPSADYLRILDGHIAQSIDSRFANKLLGLCFSVSIVSDIVVPCVDTGSKIFYLPTIYPIGESCSVHNESRSGFQARQSDWSWLFLDCIDLDRVPCPTNRILRTISLPTLQDRFDLYD